MLKFFKNLLGRRAAIAVASASAVMLTALSPLYLSGTASTAEPLATPEKIYLGMVDSSKTEKAFSTYYTAQTADGVTSYTRSSTDATAGTMASSAKRNIAVIYGKSYTDYTIEFDVSFSSEIKSTNLQRVWVLMGVSDKTAFSASSGAAALSIGIKKYDTSTTCSANYIGQGDATLFSEANFDATKSAHVKITLSGTTLTAYVNNEITGTHTIDVDYKGGYIGIGTGQKSLVISNVTVLDTVIEDTGETGIDDNIWFGTPQGTKTEGSPDTYYTVTETDGVTSYVRNSVSVATVGPEWQIATPFISLGEYKNFVAEFDFQFTGSGERYIWINLGNKTKDAFNTATGSTNFGLGIKDAASTSTYINGIYCGGNGSAWLDGGGWLDANGKGSALDGTALHHAKITVSGNILTVDIDNGTCLKKRVLSSYSGGYVMVGTNYSNTLISGLSVIDTDKVGAYNFYKTDDIVTGGKEDTGFTQYYSISGSSFVRNSKDNGTDTDNVALFGHDTYYTDFDSVFKLSFPEGEGVSYAYMSIGALTDYQSTEELEEFGAELLAIRQTAGADGRTVAVKTYSGEWSEEFTPETLLNEAYEMTVSVSGTTLTVDMDGQNLLEAALPKSYAGGYVMLGTANAGVGFSDVSFTSTASFDGIFDSYFASDLATLECGGTFGKANFDDYWDIKGGMVVRNATSTADNHTKNMAVLYIDTQKYNNFELTMRYKTVATRGAYVGFGAEKGKSWWAYTKNPADRTWDLDKGSNIVYLLPTGAVESGPTQSYIDGSNQSTWWYDTWMTQAGNLFSTDEEMASYHTLKIRVEDGKMTVWINDMSQGTITMAEYKEGYIFIAASMADNSFTAPKIVDFDNEPEYDFSDYTSYYSANIANGLKAADANDYWRINSNGNLERKSVTLTDTKDQYDMAYLALNGMTYDNFTLDLDYRHGTDGWGRFYVGFGAELGKSWREENGGMVFTIMTEGIVEYDGNLNENGKYASTIFWAITDDEGNKHQMIPNYKRAEWHHLHMEVAAGICTVTIDDYEWDFDWVLPEDFTSGNIFLAANSSSAEFKNLTVVDTSSLYEQDDFTGWEPSDEDVYFDFGVRSKKSKNIHEYKPTQIID